MGRSDRLEIPHDTALLLYYTRGASLLLIVEFFMLRAAITGTDLRRGYELLLLTGASMIVLHIWGALRGAQPAEETIEIVFYSSLVLATLMFLPPAGEPRPAKPAPSRPTRQESIRTVREHAPVPARQSRVGCRPPAELGHQLRKKSR